jgi:hypothetical protein
MDRPEIGVGDNDTIFLSADDEVQPDAEGVIESTTFPGLRLNVAAMLAGDRAGVLAALVAKRQR